jgi:hypothetical protein
MQDGGEPNVLNDFVNSQEINPQDCVNTKLAVIGADDEQEEIAKLPSPSPFSTKCCRICFMEDEDKEAGTLLSACRCEGSLKYVHQECLKTWLVAQKQDIRAPHCELCLNSY